jgi:hypothetical protein
MPFSIYTLKLLGLAETIHRWMSVLMGLDRANRERIADYAESIAGTLSRASTALAKLSSDPAHSAARSDAIRELGRIAGYVETIVAVLEQHLDGRKIAGVKRRLDTLDADRLARDVAAADPEVRPCRDGFDHLLTAEGYFRALADGLRA